MEVALNISQTPPGGSRKLVHCCIAAFLHFAEIVVSQADSGLWKICDRKVGDNLGEAEQTLTILDRLAAFHEDFGNRAALLRLNFVHDFHGFYDAYDCVR